MSDIAPLEKHTSVSGTPSLTAINTISLTPEMFEKIYLSPQNSVTGSLRKTFGNPTPVAVLGLVMALTPLSCDIMGWHGAGGAGAASTGVFFFMGGLLMVLGGVMEFLLGNTFPFVLFCGYGSWWLSYGATLTPFYNAFAAYSPDIADPAEGLSSHSFTSSFAFYLTFMALFSLICTICALRTNLTLVAVEFGLTMCFILLAASFFLSSSHANLAASLQTASGAFGFAAAISAWYLFMALMLAGVDFPISIPVGDLSSLLKGASSQDKV